MVTLVGAAMLVGALGQTPTTETKATETSFFDRVSKSLLIPRATEAKPIVQQKQLRSQKPKATRPAAPKIRVPAPAKSSTRSALPFRKPTPKRTLTTPRPGRVSPRRNQPSMLSRVGRFLKPDLPLTMTSLTNPEVATKTKVTSAVAKATDLKTSQPKANQVATKKSHMANSPRRILPLSKRDQSVRTVAAQKPVRPKIDSSKVRQSFKDERGVEMISVVPDMNPFR